ncbi:uncharacterized protein A1O5_11426, partial [Cladophialophora psammophila CBS 110553]
LPQAIPHRVYQDDYYDGYLIPKDSTVILPRWAIHMSESRGYKDPEAYNPVTNQPIPINLTAYDEGMAHCSKPFSVVFKPRSQDHVDVIKREMSDALGFLKAWDD